MAMLKKNLIHKKYLLEINFFPRTKLVIITPLNSEILVKNSTCLESEVTTVHAQLQHTSSSIQAHYQIKAVPPISENRHLV